MTAEQELRQLIAQAEHFAATGERVSAKFAEELARVWRQAEREIVDVIASGQDAGTLSAANVLSLKTQVREIVTSAGYDITATEGVSAAAVAFGRGAELVTSVEKQLAALREIATLDLLAQGDAAATALWRALVQHVLTDRPLAAILGDLRRVMDKSESHVRSLFDTLTSIYGRQVEARATEHLGPDQPFLYLGPVDFSTREWCLDRVGKVYTRAEIDTMNNGQLPNPFLTAGGYNCRHSWMAVESHDLRELVGTGQRVDTVAANVERLRKLKQEQA
jgi:hypothetical protein